MSWTKRQLLAQAFDKIGISDYEFDLDPEQIASAVSSLDAMMAFYISKGVNIGYPVNTAYNADSSDEDSNIPVWAVDPVVHNLAVRLASTLNRTVPGSAALVAREGHEVLLAFGARPTRSRRMPANVPLGAGNKTHRTGTPFSTETPSPVETDNGSSLEFE